MAEQNGPKIGRNSLLIVATSKRPGLATGRLYLLASKSTRCWRNLEDIL